MCIRGIDEWSQQLGIYYTVCGIIHCCIIYYLMQV